MAVNNSGQPTKGWPINLVFMSIVALCITGRFLVNNLIVKIYYDILISICDIIYKSPSTTHFQLNSNAQIPAISHVDYNLFCVCLIFHIVVDGYARDSGIKTIACVRAMHVVTHLFSSKLLLSDDFDVYDVRHVGMVSCSLPQSKHAASVINTIAHHFYGNRVIELSSGGDDLVKPH